MSNTTTTGAAAPKPVKPNQWYPDHATINDWVALRAEIDVLAVLSTAPHPLDPRWAPQPVRVEIRTTEPAGPDDPSRNFRAESERALQLAREVLA